MRAIDADELEKRVRDSSIRSKRSTIELIRESETIDINKVIKDLNSNIEEGD